LVPKARPGREQTPQGLVRWWRVIQKRQKNIAVAVGKRRHRLLDEGEVIFRNDAGFADAQFRVADLFDQDGSVRETLGEVDARFFIGCAG
jgi:hypothetical protein